MRITRRLSTDEFFQERAKNWPEATPVVAHLVIRIFRLAGLLSARTRRNVGARGLSVAEFEVLINLRGLAPPYELLPRELNAMMLITSGGLSKVLQTLEQKGLVARSPHDTDRRSKPVRLSARGKALAERVMRDVLTTDAALIGSAISEGEADRLVRLLRKLLTALERDASEAGS